MNEAIGGRGWPSRDSARGTPVVGAQKGTLVLTAAAGSKVAVCVMAVRSAVLPVALSVALSAVLFAALSAATPAGSAGASGRAGSMRPGDAAGSGARGVVAPGGSAGELRAVAGDAGTGVAAGGGVLWWSAPTHLVWHPAAGVDSTLNYTAVVKAGGRYLAMAEDGSAWISADAEGKSFLRRAAAASRPLRALAQVGGAALVAVGDSGTIVRCADLNGVTWTAPASPVSTHLRGIAWNGVSAVAVGDGGTLLRAGSPGAEWQVVAIAETRDLLAVTADPPPGSPGRYLAVGRDGAAWRGEGDGLTWTRLDGFATGALHGAAWVGPTAVAVGDAGGIYWSPGAFENWAAMVSTVTTSLRAVAWTEGGLLAVGADDTILWSLDGREWRRAEVPVPANEVSWGRVKQLFRR